MEEIWPNDELRGDFWQNLEKPIFSPNFSRICLGFYIPKNPVARMIQCAAIASENEV